MRFLRRSLAAIFLLSLTFGLFAIAGSSVYSALQSRWADEAPARPARERVVTVNVIAAEPQTVTPVLSTFGEVRSRRTLELRASAAGEVVWLADGFEDGGAVAAGALLARIDPQDAQGNLDVARTDLSEAQAELRDARRSLELARDDLTSAEEQAALRDRALARQVDLVARGVGTEAAVETAELAASAARQAVLSRRQALAQAEARLDLAATAMSRREIAVSESERRLADTEIYAEFSGVLSEVSVVEGRLVSNNETLAQIVDPTALEVSFRVSTSQYARLLDGSGRLSNPKITASLDGLGSGLIATGQISRESATVAEGQTGRLLFARLDDAPGFRPGDFVTIEITEPALDRVVLLPAAAVDAAGTVLAVGEEDRLEVLDVTVLRRQGDDVILRGPGLAGREIVAERTPLLGAGIKVRPVRPGGAEPEPAAMIELDAERRARLVAFVESNSRMPDAAKERILGQLAQDKVPSEVVQRLESRMGS